jgi:hypothetical protein
LGGGGGLRRGAGGTWPGFHSGDRSTCEHCSFRVMVRISHQPLAGRRARELDGRWATQIFGRPYGAFRTSISDQIVKLSSARIFFSLSILIKTIIYTKLHTNIYVHKVWSNHKDKIVEKHIKVRNKKSQKNWENFWNKLSVKLKKNLNKISGEKKKNKIYEQIWEKKFRRKT